MADKYYTSTFLPIKKNLQTKELSWAVPGLLQDAYAAYTADYAIKATKALKVCLHT